MFKSYSLEVIKDSLLNLGMSSFFMENYGVYQFYRYICKIVMMY